jgi:hypothetical protein
MVIEFNGKYYVGRSDWRNMSRDYKMTRDQHGNKGRWALFNGGGRGTMLVDVELVSDETIADLKLRLRPTLEGK